MERSEDFDELGWAAHPVSPWERRDAFTLFSADAHARLERGPLAGHAARLFGATLSLSPEKSFPRGSQPRADAAHVSIAGPFDGRAEVRLMPIDRAAALRIAARKVAEDMGGAGMDVLVARARTIIQVQALPESAASSLAIAAVFASVTLAPILPPLEDVLFAIKGARERLTLLTRLSTLPACKKPP
ncbi:MAG: hypothetical protein U0271_09170 [Polyangiaceae bacterium]